MGHNVRLGQVPDVGEDWNLRQVFSVVHDGMSTHSHGKETLEKVSCETKQSIYICAEVSYCTPSHAVCAYSNAQ